MPNETQSSLELRISDLSSQDRLMLIDYQRVVDPRLLRSYQEFQWLRRMIPTILPHTTSAEILDSSLTDSETGDTNEKFLEVMGNLSDADFIYCLINIFCDDRADTAVTDEERKFMDILLNATYNYFDNLFKGTGEKFLLEFPSLDNESKECIGFQLSLVRRLYEKITTLPLGADAMVIQPALKKYFASMIEANKRSYAYRKLVLAGDLEGIRRFAPTVADFIEITKHGMGTDFMHTMAAATYRPFAVPTVLAACEDILVLGRIANDLCFKPEEPNLIAHAAYLSTKGNQAQANLLEIQKLLKIRDPKTKAKLAHAFFLSKLTPEVIEELRMISERSMDQIKELDKKYPEYGFSGISSGLDVFFRSSLTRSPRLVQNIVNIYWQPDSRIRHTFGSRALAVVDSPSLVA